MKTLLLAGILITSSAFARIVSEEPSIRTVEAAVNVKVSNFCINGDKVETKTAVNYCVEYDKVWVQDNGSRSRSNGHWTYECIATEFGKLTHPIEYTKAVCHREYLRDNGGDKYLGPCTYTYEPATLATSYTFNIYKTTGRQTDYDVRSGQGLRKIETKTVNFSACK